MWNDNDVDLEINLQHSQGCYDQICLKPVDSDISHC